MRLPIPPPRILSTNHKPRLSAHMLMIVGEETSYLTCLSSSSCFFSQTNRHWRSQILSSRVMINFRIVRLFISLHVPISVVRWVRYFLLLYSMLFTYSASTLEAIVSRHSFYRIDECQMLYVLSTSFAFHNCLLFILSILSSSSIISGIVLSPKILCQQACLSICIHRMLLG